MGLLLGSVIAASAVTLVLAQNGTRKSGYEWVDPLIGTTNGGLQCCVAKLESRRADNIQAMFSQAQRCLSVSHLVSSASVFDLTM
jgi:hypothetical protein